MNEWIFIVITYLHGIEKGKVTRGLALTLPCVIICYSIKYSVIVRIMMCSASLDVLLYK